MQSVLTKLYKIATCFSLEDSIASIFVEKLYGLIQKYLNNVRLNQDLVVDTITLLFYVQLWKMTTIVQNVRKIGRVFNS